MKGKVKFYNETKTAMTPKIIPNIVRIDLNGRSNIDAKAAPTIPIPGILMRPSPCEYQK
mgnify:CR=1 FL=1